LKPSRFKYLAPETIQDALDLLARHGTNARILAGGQSLVPILNFRLAAYDVLIDINRVRGLSHIRQERDWLHLGSLTRQRAIETSRLVFEVLPFLREVTLHIAHLPIRTRGTVGGSISHADPAAEDPAAMLALEAEFDIQSATRKRTVKAEDFFLGPMQTVLAPDELLTDIRIPLDPASERTCAFEEVSRRRGDFAIIGIAAALTWRGDRVAKARIAVCGAESGATRLRPAEAVLEGEIPSTGLIRAAADAAVRSVAVHDDIHASADYRRHLVSELVKRTVTRTLQATA
jgi:aerobic carbon-monoxide dehydrogenase medium subunit